VKKTEKLELLLIMDDAKEDQNFFAQWLRADMNACKWRKWMLNVVWSTPTTQTNPASVKRKTDRMQIALYVKIECTVSTRWKNRSTSSVLTNSYSLKTGF